MRKATDSVRIVVFDKADPARFLVLCEADDLGNWKLPGGSFEGDETPAQAATRELAEELGAKPQDIKLRQVSELTNDDGVSKRYIFTGSVDTNGVKPSDEIAEVQWFTDETVPDCKNRGHILSAVAAARSVSSKSARLQ